jgi:hypothetical protein
MRDDTHSARIDAEELDCLTLRELRDGDHEACPSRQARKEDSAVVPSPPVEGVGMAEDAEIVNGHHDRDAGLKWPAVAGAVEDIGSVPNRAEWKGAEVPQQVARDFRRPRCARERVAPDGNAVETVEQVAEVAGGPRVGQLEGRDVDSESEISHCVTPRLARRVFYTL